MLFIFFNPLLISITKNLVHMQLHMQAVMWRQAHAKPRGGETTSKPKDTLANKKPEEK